MNRAKLLMREIAEVIVTDKVMLGALLACAAGRRTSALARRNGRRGAVPGFVGNAHRGPFRCH